MEVGMSSFFIGCITAFLFGMMLWGIRFLMGWFGMLLFGISFWKKRRGRVFHECAEAFYAVLFTTLAIMFLYYVNRGIFRWFLVAAMIASFYLSVYVSRRTGINGRERTAGAVRHVIFVALRFVFFPICKCLSFIYKIVRSVLLKFALRIAGKYDKIKVRKYDKRKRAKISSSAKRELLILESVKVEK